MDVLLVKDVERLGSEGAVVHVKPGFARNFLFPRGLAVAATPQHLQALDAAKRRRAQQAQRLKEQAEALKRRLESRSLTLKLTLGEEDKPFGSVTVHDLLEALKREGLEIEKPAVQLDHPIKALGIYNIPVRLHAEVLATLKVWVVKA